MTHLQGKFVWFEHLSTDIAAARRFYEDLFGWHTESMPMGAQRYSMILNGSQGIGGYANAPQGVRPNWLTYLSVSNVDSAYAAALAAGAVSKMAPAQMGDAGRSAIITDPTGATVALWQSAQGDTPDVKQAPVGNFCWNELWTGNDRSALAFYERVFGYGHDSMDMGPQGTYYMLTRDGQQRAGVMRSTDPKAPPMWLPYVAVGDADAIVARATELNAQVLHAPQDIPGIGRFAIFQDPLGAALAVIRLQPMAANQG